MITINKNLIYWILAIAVGFYAYDSGLIAKVEATPTPIPTEAPGSPNEVAIATAMQNLQNLTPTPGSAGAGQLATAIPKTVILDTASAEQMRQLMQSKMSTEIVDWLITARLTTGGGAHYCFVGWYPKPGTTLAVSHPDKPLWQLIDEGVILTADEIGWGGCKTTVMVGDLLAGIPASYLKDPNNFVLSTEQYTYETESAIITASRVIVEVRVPYGLISTSVQPGNEVTLQSQLPNEYAAYRIDYAKFLFSLGNDVSNVWVNYGATENGADNLALLDLIAPILDWRNGSRDMSHLDKLAELTQQSIKPGNPAYETIRKIVCAAAEESGFKDIPAQLEDGTPATLKKCEVRIVLVGPNPTEPDEWYHLDSIPPSWPATMTDTAGWANYLASLRRVINQEEFTRLNWDNAYVLYQPDLQSGAWWPQVPEQLRLYAP